MAKSKHTFAKRQREIEKKRKAEEKRARRLQRKESTGGARIITADEMETGIEAEENETEEKKEEVDNAVV